MRIAELFLTAAIEHAENGPAQAANLIEDYFNCDNETASLRVWYWASVGPILPGSRDLPSNASTLAALQCVAAHLNDDETAAQDVTAAHFDVAGHEGLFSMVFEFVGLCSFLVKEGAFR